METTTTSKQFRLNLSDGLKGFIMAVGTPVLYMLQELIPGWNLNPILQAAIAATITYLLKNLFTPSAIVVKGASEETVKAVKDGTAEVTVTPT